MSTVAPQVTTPQRCSLRGTRAAEGADHRERGRPDSSAEGSGVDRSCRRSISGVRARFDS